GRRLDSVDGGRRAPVDRLAVGRRHVRVVGLDRVALGAAGDVLDLPVARLDRVGPRAAVEAVHAGSPVENVVPAVADQGVVPRAPDQGALAGAAGQAVAGGTAHHHVHRGVAVA